MNITTRTRKKLNMTQRQFADALDINVRTVWRWEHGHTCPPLYVRKVFEHVPDIFETPYYAGRDYLNPLGYGLSTYVELADRLGVTGAAVGQWRSGARTPPKPIILLLRWLTTHRGCDDSDNNKGVSNG